MNASATDEAALAAWQQNLIAALWAPTHDAALRQLAGPEARDRVIWRGLAAYRSHAAGQAERSLRTVYPVIQRLLGEEDFGALARWFWRLAPPTRGDLACWGEALAQRLPAQPELLADQPWLVDLARTEWALHRAATAPDAAPEPATFALLASTDPERLQLELAPGCCCLPGAWSVVSLIRDAVSAPAAPHAGETALVWRAGWRPRVRAAHAGEAAFVQSLLQGLPLAAALSAAPDLDFSAWLAPAVHEGLLLRVYVSA